MNMIRFLSIAILALPGIVGAVAARTVASVTTLEFEARIDSFSGKWEATEQRSAPPLTLEVGDLITGSITFDSEESLTTSNEVTQFYGIQLTIDGVNLTTDRITAHVMNDRRFRTLDVDYLYGGPVIPDPNILVGHQLADKSLPAIDDRIELTRYVGIPHDVDAKFPHAPNWRWQPTFSLAGPTSTLEEDGRLPSDLATWNSFTHKTFLFGLDHPAHFEANGRQHHYFEGLAASATITSFNVAPEPTAAILATLAALALCSCRVQRKRTSITSEKATLDVSSV